MLSSNRLSSVVSFFMFLRCDVLVDVIRKLMYYYTGSLSAEAAMRRTRRKLTVRLTNKRSVCSEVVVVGTRLNTGA